MSAEQTEWISDALRNVGNGPDKNVQPDLVTVKTKMKFEEKYSLFWKSYVPYQEYHITYWMQYWHNPKISVLN